MELFTELFYRDPYAREFTSRVVSCSEGKKGFEVTLEDTAFYPEGGGQPADHGTLGGAAVLDVRRRGGDVVHFVDKPLEAGSEVKGAIDWERRFDNMQNHTGEHVLSGIIHAKKGFENTGFHMDDQVITCDFSGELTEEEIALCEKEANAAIAANVPVETLFPTREELAALPYRSKKELEGAVRIVRAGPYDTCACCGTHVARTGEIGIIKVLSAARHRGGTRIEFVCGGRALRDYAAKTAQAHRVSALLSAKTNEIAPAVDKLLEAEAARDKKIAAVNERYFDLLAKSIEPGTKFVLLREDGLSQLELKKLAAVLADAGRAAVAAIVAEAGETDVWNYILCSPSEDLRESGKALNMALNGRGGGNGKFIQGTYRKPFAEVESLLRETFSD